MRVLAVFDLNCSSKWRDTIQYDSFMIPSKFFHGSCKIHLRFLQNSLVIGFSVDKTSPVFGVNNGLIGIQTIIAGHCVADGDD